MSSILKALKKLEEQKAPRPQYELDLSSGIMRERKVARHRPWVIPAAMAAVAIVAAIFTYAVMAMRHQSVTKGIPPEVASVIAPLPPQASPARLPVPGMPAAPARQNTDPAPSSVAAAPPAAVGVRPAPRPAHQSTKGDAPAGQVRPPANAAIPATTGASPPPAERAEIPARMPNLKLSGIAWQKDSASRYAVVNGMAVSQGSTIEGAKIEEILPDRVRFSFGSRTLEVPMAHMSPTQ